MESVSYLHLRSSSSRPACALTTHNLDSQGGFLDTSEPKHSPGHRGTWRSGNPDTPERNPEETGGRRTRTLWNETQRKRSVPESGQGESGLDLRAGRLLQQMRLCGIGGESRVRSTSLGQLSARGEGTSLAARWRDTGDSPTPRVRVLPAKSSGLGSASPSPERPTPWAASIQDSKFLRISHARFLFSH